MSNGSLLNRTVVISGGSRGIALPIVGSSRSPEIMADAAVEVISRPSREATGNRYIDADVLHSAGAADLSRYGSGETPIPNLFLD